MLGHEIVVHTDHKNLVHKHFNTKRVMRWRLLLEEFRPKLLYIKGEQNIVADALSRLDLSEEDFAPDLFAFDEEDFPSDYPLSYTQIMCEQSRCPELQAKLESRDDKYKKQTHAHADKSCDIITQEGKIVVPPALQRRAAEW